MSDLGVDKGRSAPPRFSSVLDRLREKRRAVAPGIGPRPRDPRGTPLSFAQQRLWFMEQLEPGTPVYNIPFAVSLTGRLDVAAMAGAMREIVRRHEALRTTFRTVDGQPLQVISPAVPVELPVVDLERAATEAEVRRLALAEARRTFDLERGPLLRLTLLHLGPERHVLLLSLHHLVGDAWSIAVLLQELTPLYAAALAGRRADLPALPLQYPDFALWQNERLAGDVLERHLAVWRARLAGSPPVARLPTDRPRPARRAATGGRVPLRFPAGLARRLDALARREETTLFTVILAALQALLHRWSGEEDLVVGTPVANRQRSEIQGLVGLFVNMLAMRADLSGRPTFRELLRRTHETVVEAQDHQELPFEKLVEELQPERTTSHAPLFQVVLAFQNVPMPVLRLPGLELTPRIFDPGTAMFDLTLNLDDRPDGLVGWWEHSAALFDRTTVLRLSERFRLLLEGLETGLDRPLAELPFLTEAETHQSLREWNSTAAEYPRAPRGLLHEMIEAQVDRAPEAEALAFEDERITYRELDRRANRLAWHLIELGVGPDVRVGVFAERSLEMVVGLLGILKAGGAYVPLDPGYPEERVGFMARDARMPVILTQARLAAAVPAVGAAVVCLDSDAGAHEHRPRVTMADSHLAYVIFTSGSTGKPKGVMIPHAGIRNRLLWMQEACGLTAGDRVLQKTPFSFDVSVWEFFWPLMTGATLVMAAPGGHQDPAYLARVLEEERISTVHFVPSMLQAFLAWPEIGPCRRLKRVMVSGEALPEELRRRFYERLETPELHNLYGPTEASVDVTSWACPRWNDLGTVPIGRPIANTQIHLVDRDSNPVPPGSAGELAIGGVSLARGYLERPDLTAERFVPDPFSLEPGGRLYRTGDLARHLPGGEIEYLGRLDHQVKIRGFRIELGEIEASLVRHPGVREAAVLAREDRPGDRRLVAYVVGDEVTDLRDFLHRSLPEHMVPSAVVRLDSLPLTPSGKVDRRALPAPGESARETALPAPPRTPVEEILCEIWAEALDTRPGIHDNFFTLGGHSLLAPRIVAGVRQAFGVDIPLRVVFDHPTVARLAAAILEARWQHRGAGIPLRRTGSTDPQPLSFPQLRFWARRSGKGSLANAPMGISFTGELDVAALHRSLEEILRRHEVLRAGFSEVDGEPVQLVRPEVCLPMPVVDLAALPPPLREGEARRLAVEAGRYPFDLELELLVRATLVRLGEREHALLLVKNHLVTDGWSEGILGDELAALYEAFTRRQPSPLPELPVQYGDFAAWQRQVLQGPVFDELLGYWLRRLDDGRFPVLPVPTDLPRPATPDLRGARRSRKLPAGLSEAVRRIGRLEGASLFMTLLTTFDLLLARWTGATDVSLATNIANRGQVEIERLIGLFTNVLALRADLSGDPTFREALARVRESTLAAYAHQELPFVELLQRFLPGRPDAYNELFPAGIVLQSFPTRPLALPGVEGKLIDMASGVAPRDLILVVVDRGPEMEAHLLYRKSLFRPETIDGLLAGLEAVLAAVTADPDIRLSGLPEL
jgi:amino acid adenylation domain-containing protein